MSRLTKLQPNDGERVLTCSHTNDLDARPFHFFSMSPPMPFTRPDKTTGTATWAVLCNRCFRYHHDNFAPVITNDAEWIGDEPIVKDDSN